MKNFSKGIIFEEIACKYLKSLGYVILVKRFKRSCGEIDVIAKNKNLITFIEVKFRKNIKSAAYAITERQKQRIIQTAEIFIQENENILKNCDFRFDAILFSQTSIQYIKNAFCT